MIRVENAPELSGYSYEGTIKNEFAELFRIHCYSDEVYILEICVSENEDFSWDDYSGEEDDSESEDEVSLYAGEVLRYLILPKGTSVPEEIEEDMIPLTLPIQSIYASENSVRENLKATGYSGNMITSTSESGIRKKRKAETAETDTVSEEKAVTNSPSEAETDTELTESEILLRLINEDVDLSILSAEDTGDIEELLKLACVCEKLDIPVMLDLSKCEDSADAEEEWENVFGLLD